MKHVTNFKFNTWFDPNFEVELLEDRQKCSFSFWCKNAKYTLYSTYLPHHQKSLRLCSLGVHTTSRILTADSQKLTFSTLIKVPFLVFWSNKSSLRASSAQLACSTKLSRQARQSLRVEGHGPSLIKFTFLKSLQKVV